MSSPNSRNETFDQVTGIYILWMIAIHAIQWSNLPGSLFQSALENSLFALMPWFYAKSGFFHSPTRRSFFAEIQRGTKTLLIPFAFWYIIGFLIGIFPTLSSNRPLWWKLFLTPILTVAQTGQAFGNDPVWFLLSLFLVKIFASQALRIKQWKWISASFLVIGWLFSSQQRLLPLGMQSFFLGFFFYSLGYGLQNSRFPSFNTRWILLAFAGWIGIQIFIPSNVDFRINHPTNGLYLVFVLASLATMLLISRACKLFPSRIFQWFGKKSMYFFVIHWLIFHSILRTFSFLNLPTQGFVFFLCLYGASVAICSVIAWRGSRIPFLFGKPS